MVAILSRANFDTDALASAHQETDIQ